MTCRRWLISSLAILLLLPSFVHAQTVVNLGKPTPNAQNQIAVNVQTALGALPATPAACTVSPIPGTGPYTVSFAASTDHSVVEHGAPKVAAYELVINPPTTGQLCYTAQVRAVGPGGSGVSALSSPFPLVPGAPAAPGTAPAITRPAAGSRVLPGLR